MKNYNDPDVWEDFLQRQEIQTDAPPPPVSFLRRFPKKDHVERLRSWADRFGQRATSFGNNVRPILKHWQFTFPIYPGDCE